MKKGKRTINRMLSWLLAVAMVITMLPVSAISVKAETVTDDDSTVSLLVDKTPKLEVALALGSTKHTQQASFETDLKAELEALKIPSENISFVKVDASASAAQDSFQWWTYDHKDNATSHNDTTHTYYDKTEYDPSDSNHYDRIPTSQYSDTKRSDGTVVPSHIDTLDSGKTMNFYGYGSRGYKDFNYLPNQQATKKTIEFTIEEKAAHDALDGLGFLVNTSITGDSYSTQKINGYLIFLQYTGSVGEYIKLFKLTNVSVNALHNANLSVRCLTSVSGVSLLATASTSYGNYRYRKIKIEIMPDYLIMWYNGSSTNNFGMSLGDSNLVQWPNAVTKYPLTPGYDTVSNTVDGTVISKEVYRGGYGPLASYGSHGCSALTLATLSNLKMEAEYVRSLTEVVREPNWSDDKVSFLVNLNEDPIEDFSKTYTTAEIINRLEQENVTYIGWCGEKNVTESQQFVDGIRKGSGLVNMNAAEFVEDNDCYSKASYDLQVKEIARLIAAKVAQQETEGGTYTYLDTDDFHFTSTGASLDDGNWSVGYNAASFEDAKKNVRNYSNLENASFLQTGYYEVYYAGDTETPKARIKIHRAPKALFLASISENNAVVVQNKSYDPDVNATGENADGTASHGIKSYKLEYRNVTTGGEWSEISPDTESVSAGELWTVRLTVTDNDGATAMAIQQVAKQVESGGEQEAEQQAPFNAFTLSKSRYVIGIDTDIEVIDQSYSLDGKDFTVSYSLKKTGAATATSLSFTPQTLNKYALSNLGNNAEGTYVISMTAKSENGTAVSPVISRSFEVKEGYKVCYHDNATDASGSPADDFKMKGEAFTISSIAPARSGYIFAGWAKTADGEVAYQPGDVYKVDAALDLYAVWKKPFVYQAKDYTGVYDGDGHNISVTVTQPATMDGVKIYYAQAANENSEVTESNINQETFSLTNVGTYKVYYKITHPDYLTVSGYRTVKITKADPTVTLANKVHQTVTSSAQTVDNAQVTGVKGEALSGNVSYTYYTDKNTKMPTSAEKDGSTTEGGAPKNKGVYYVKASFDGNANYNAAVSNIAQMIIAPDVYYYNAQGNQVYGTLEDVLAATDNPKKRIYIESSMELNSDVTIPEGYTLFIDSEATLTIPKEVTLTNNGTIRNSGTIDGGGKLINNKTFDGGQVETEFVNNEKGNVTYTDFVGMTPVTNKGTLNDCSGGQVTNEGNGLVKTDNKVVVYKVSFDVKANLDDKTLAENPEDQSINCGDKIVDEPQITDIEEVAKFQGWYLDQTCSDGKKWDFANDTVNSDITLYAKWEEFSTYEAYWVDEDGKKHFGTFEEVLEQMNADGNNAESLHIQKTVTTNKDIKIPDGIPVIIDKDAELKLKSGTTFDAPGGITNNGEIKAADEEGGKPVIKCGTESKTGIENNGKMTGIKADSDVTNNENATISNSELAKDLDNSGTVSDSKADGNVTNHESGTLANTDVDDQKLKNEGKYTTNGNEVTHTVTYNVTSASGDDITITGPARDTVVHGGLASFKRPTVIPSETDLVFSGWYKENSYSNKWNFAEDVVTADVVLYTKLQPASVFEAYWIDPTGGVTYGTLTDALASESTMVTIRKDITLPDSIEIPENMTVVVSEGVTVTIPSDKTVKLNGELQNNGTIYNNGTIQGSGKVTNNMTIYGGTIETDVENNRKIDGTKLSGDVKNGGTGTISSGTLSGDVTNKGKISDSSMSGDVTNDGKLIDCQLTETSHVTNNSQISGCDIQGEVTNVGDGMIRDDNLGEVSYEVTFNLNEHGGDNTPASQTIVCGKKVDEPTGISDKTYVLTGWYKEAECQNKWNFATNTVSKNITLYACWREKSSYEAYWVNKNGETEYGTFAEAAEAAGNPENNVSAVYVQKNVTVSEYVTLSEDAKLVVQSGVIVTVESGTTLAVSGGIENNGTIKAGAETGEKPQITGPVTNKQGASIQGCDITGDVDNSGAISQSTINGKTTNSENGTIKNSQLNGDVENNGAISATAIQADNVINNGAITGGSIAGKDNETKVMVSNHAGSTLSGVDVTGDVANDGKISDNTQITGDVNNNGTIDGVTTINGNTKNSENGTIRGSKLNGDVENNGAISATAIQADNVINNGNIIGGSIAGKDENSKATVTNGEKGTIEDSNLSGQKVNNEGTLKNNNLSDANVDNTNGTMTGEGDEAIIHTVTFDLNGHGDETQAPEVQTVAYDKKATCPANPQDAEYTMTGWYKEKECTNKWDFAKDTVKTDITLYAKWELRSSYEAYWITQDGEQRYGTIAEALASGSNEVTIQKNVTLPAGTVIPADMCVRIPDTIVVTIPEGSTVTVDGKLNNAGTIYNNGAIVGSGTVENEKAIYGGSIAPAVTNSGKIDGSTIAGAVTNSGRITDSTLINTVVNENGGAITDSTMSGNVTNDGMISGGKLTESSSITNNKNISGCDIKGNVVNTDSGKIVDSSLDSIQYTVTFTRNGRGEDVPVENVPDAQIVDCGRYVTEPDAIKDTDYVFIGWYKEAECQNKWNFNTDTVNSGITLYAKWREKTTYEAYWINEAGEFEYGTFEEVLKAANEAGATQVHVQGDTVVAQPLVIPEGMQVTVDPEATLTFGEGGSLTVNGMLTNQGTITGVSGNGEPQIIGNVTNASDAKITNCGLQGNVENAGSITGSGMIGNVTNTGDIANSAITGDLTNAGFVRETALQGNLNNAADGELDNSVVNGSVDNAGKISGGSIEGETIHNSGEIFAAEIETTSMSNDGTVSGGSIAGKEGADASVTNSADARLDGVTVTGDVKNDGTITNGSTISGTTTNNGTIKDSTLNGTVDNKGTLENSDFEGAEVDNTEGTVIEGDNDQTLSYMVSFHTGSYGEAPQSQTVEYGKKATCPLDPVDETYAFAGWYQDEACTQPFDFNVTVIKKPTTIYGKWVSKSETEAYWTVGNETKYGTLTEALASGSKDIHITKSLEIAKDIMIPEGVTVTVESGVTVSLNKDTNVTVAKDAQLINNGKLDNNGTIAGDGTVINNKNITGGAVDADITNNGTVNSTELNGQVTNNKAINDCEINAGLNNQNGTVSKDGDQVVYKDTQLKGAVVKETGEMQQTQANATIKLVQGNKVIQEVKTAADGTYDLSEVPSGSYNLVIESAEGNINTLLAQVSGDAIQMEEIRLPEGNLNNVVEVKAGAPDVVVGGLDEILNSVTTEDTAGITPTDKAAANRGGSVEVRFVAEQIERIPEEALDMERIIEEDNKQAGMNLDFSVFKTVTSAQDEEEEMETKLTELQETIMINIPIEEALRGKNNYIVYRFHDNQVDRITEDSEEEYFELQQDGEAITLYAKKFSTYVLAYEKATATDTDLPGENPEQPGTDTPGTEQPGQKPADGTEDKQPDTGNTGNEVGQNPADGADTQNNPYRNLTDEQKVMAQTLAEQLQLTAEQAVETVQFAQENGVETDTLLVTESTIVSQPDDTDIKGSTFARIRARASKTKANSVTLKWNKVKGADGYVVYGNKCGSKNKLQYITTVTGKTSFTQKKLKKGTYYKYAVCAYKQIGDKKVTIALSKTVHATTVGGKYGVAKSVKTNKSTVKLSQGKKFRLKAQEVKKDKKISHHRNLAFESSNPAVATVTKKGVIKGVKKGTCYIYVYAQNGVYKRVKVTVK